MAESHIATISRRHIDSIPVLLIYLYVVRCFRLNVLSLMVVWLMAVLGLFVKGDHSFPSLQDQYQVLPAAKGPVSTYFNYSLLFVSK